jgi:hypothetical protein
MLSGLRLPFQYDRSRLVEDLCAIPSSAWAPHYNKADYGGVWRGAALRSVSGEARQLFAGAAAYRDTPLLDLCPYFRQVMAAFECPLRSVRLLSLAPGSFIREHTDNALDYEDGQVRIHVPVQTNPDVEFYLSGERLLFEVGATYYVNVNLPHRVSNRGDCERIHLVIDAEVNDWVRELFGRGAPIPRSLSLPAAISTFRERLWDEPEWQDRLRPIGDARDFEREAVCLGREAGLDLHDGDVDAALRGSPRVAPADWRPSSAWTPVRFFARADQPWAEWIETGGRPFTEPFFEDTVAGYLRAPFARFSRCEAPLAESQGAREPLGFLFHMSRCGSTLAAQMLKTLPGVSVFSEPAPVDQAVQAGNPEWLRRIVAALGTERQFLVKLDAWHIHALPLIREAFPRVPWVFLYRDPAEVLQSQLRGPGRHCVPGMVDAAHLRVDPADCPVWDLPGWSARVTGAILRSAAAFREAPGGLFVDYAELPEAVISRIAPHFGIVLTEDDAERMRAKANFDSKSPGVPFSSSGKPQRHEQVDPLVREFGLDLLHRQLLSFPVRSCTMPGTPGDIRRKT